MEMTYSIYIRVCIQTATKHAVFTKCDTGGEIRNGNSFELKDAGSQAWKTSSPPVSSLRKNQDWVHPFLWLLYWREHVSKVPCLTSMTLVARTTRTAWLQWIIRWGQLVCLP